MLPLFLDRRTSWPTLRLLAMVNLQIGRHGPPTFFIHRMAPQFESEAPWPTKSNVKRAMAPGFNSSNNRLSLAREFTQRAVRFAMARGEWKSPSHEGDRKSKTPAGAGRSGADATDRWRWVG